MQTKIQNPLFLFRSFENCFLLASFLFLAKTLFLQGFFGSLRPAERK